MTGHCRRSKERNEWREELEADHRPKVVQRRLAERGRPSYLADAILGGMDGCVTTFAVVAGAVGGGFSSVSPPGEPRTKGGYFLCRQMKRTSRSR
jgi:hypothetical protein